jgi:hypothetical protein
MKKKTESEIKQEKLDVLMDGVDRWAAFYRANPHRFAKDYLGLRLKKFQQIILCMMFRFPNTIYLASRGGGKTFLIAIFCVVHSILYPGTRICVASRTRRQAAEVIEKIQGILMTDSQNLREEIKTIKVSQYEVFMRFKNDSRIAVVTSGESARGNRATILIVDEFRMVCKTVVDSILKKFLTSPRHPGFLDKPEYASYPAERTKAVYASSCWYESHWSYDLVKDFVNAMSPTGNHFCCSMPYQLAIAENLLDKERVEDDMLESNFNSVSFQMEMEALFFGQGDGGLFAFNEIEKNRQIKFPFYPTTPGIKLNDKRLSMPQKQSGETRILSVDIALMASSKHKNDATSIFLNQVLRTSSGKCVNNIVYTENNEGLRTDAQALQIRRLFYDYECDHLVVDCKGLGLGVVDALLADIYDPLTGETYGALSCRNNEDIAKRCLVKNAPKVIWAVQGSSEFNSRCAVMLREAFKQGQVKLLIPDFDMEETLAELPGYNKLSPADKLNLQLPYVHTSLLVNELINLEHEIRGNVIKVKEKSGMRKDRYSSLSYNIYVSKEIEHGQNIERAKRTGSGLVMKIAPPKIK